MAKRTGLFRALTFIMALLLAVSSVAGVMLERFRQQVDETLGTTSQKVVSTGEGTLWTAFTPPQELRNEDGTLNTHATIQHFIDFSRELAAGGTVLLKNNGVLPLQKGISVSLLGMKSYYPILASGQGMPIVGSIITLEDALSKNRTDFRNARRNVQRNNIKPSFKKLDDYDFEGAEMKINPVPFEAYEGYSKEFSGWGRFTYIPSMQSFNDDISKHFDDPSLETIEKYAPSFMDSLHEYNDAAIVVVGRPSSENGDYAVGGVYEGQGNTEPLELTTNEREIIRVATENFDKVVVLVNCVNAIEIAELQNNDKIDAILWIAHPGSFGMLGVADVLVGNVSPSGGLPDTYAAKNLSAPAMANFGDYKFTNFNTDGSADTSVTRVNSHSYVVEAESIYVGYRYYETRYNDIVYGLGNADSKTGVFASQGNWRYNEEVVYPFGFGLSYTTFTQELVGDPVISRAGHHFTMDFTVQVTNTGSVAGKSNIQLYAQAPYIQGGVEKSAIQLAAYDITGLLQPGQSETKVLHVDMQDVASYDMLHKNADGTQGTWILDAGDYYFTVANGSHAALNNVLAKQGKTVANTNGLMDADGDAKAVFAYHYNGINGSVDDNTFAVSKNNAAVSNHLEYSDWNYYEPDKVTQLSRADWEGIWPKEYKDMTAPASMLADLNGKYYEVKKDDDTSKIVFGANNGLKFYDLAFRDFDDPDWQKLIDQMTIDECLGLLCYGGNEFRDIPSIGFIRGSFTENSGNGMQSEMCDARVDAPWAVSKKDNNGHFYLELYATAPTVASSFDPNLQFRMGEEVGLQALIVGLPILWGPGLNTHRTAYNGRNGDYYSEDPILTGNTGMEFAIGAFKYGLLASPKHFAFNDQETNRGGVAPFMTEQRAREVELRAFQIPMEANKYDAKAPEYWNGEENHDFGMRGMMTSFSKIGGVECTASEGLITGIAKNEWGFKGYAVTDIGDDVDLFAAVANSGVTGYDLRGRFSESGYDTQTNDGQPISAEMFAGDANILTKIKEAAHNTIWAFCQTNLMNAYDSSTEFQSVTTWWRVAYNVAILTTGGLFLAFATLYTVSVIKSKKEGK